MTGEVSNSNKIGGHLMNLLTVHEDQSGKYAIVMNAEGKTEKLYFNQLDTSQIALIVDQKINNIPLPDNSPQDYVKTIENVSAAEIQSIISKENFIPSDYQIIDFAYDKGVPTYAFTDFYYRESSIWLMYKKSNAWGLLRIAKKTTTDKWEIVLDLDSNVHFDDVPVKGFGGSDGPPPPAGSYSFVIRTENGLYDLSSIGSVDQKTATYSLNEFTFSNIDNTTVKDYEYAFLNDRSRKWFLVRKDGQGNYLYNVADNSSNKTYTYSNETTIRESEDLKIWAHGTINQVSFDNKNGFFAIYTDLAVYCYANDGNDQKFKLHKISKSVSVYIENFTTGSPYPDISQFEPDEVFVSGDATLAITNKGKLIDVNKGILLTGLNFTFDHTKVAQVIGMIQNIHTYYAIMLNDQTVYKFASGGPEYEKLEGEALMPLQFYIDTAFPDRQGLLLTESGQIIANESTATYHSDSAVVVSFPASYLINCTFMWKIELEWEDGTSSSKYDFGGQFLLNRTTPPFPPRIYNGNDVEITWMITQSAIAATIKNKKESLLQNAEITVKNNFQIL
ncbi:hypothetical protein [Aureibacter tunicatorum]|uniref:Uncharacterized protein n=1 Tax=Aureibacter tunicatorum TaxID=866807 RepID=A0AAE3XQ89_9BACT|nr:hypothetical protein [Aureibacter tunicatorum]MDR6239941.1 hypothetical protein [Aureibacter tunicatorum]BDD04415.1 hypothetical protein AUTU_18980 [Aureibacter tunicatorum]